ncbi:MAG TPA: hypothetical protein VEH06_01250 [Candidatus Bathyarchaeia archaeon]|nr:hypothetical protein [Candidatus Bathyarchaeia archaeon]
MKKSGPASINTKRECIWRIVNNEAKRIRGHCEKFSEEYLKSHC